MNKKKQGPKKGAAKKWSERLKKIGEQAPPGDLMKILNETEKPSSSISSFTGFIECRKSF